MPYQDRHTLDDELQADSFEEGAPPPRATTFVLLVILVVLVAAGIATAFALLHPPA